MDNKENKENKYNNAKIYKIVCNVSGDVYFGSTTEKTLANRLTKHKSKYNQFLKGKRAYGSIFKILETNNYDIILVENYSCTNRDELFARERYYIENNKCINKQLPIRTIEEKQEIYNKDYYKQSRINNNSIVVCDCDCELKKYSLNRHKNTQKHKSLIQNNKQNIEQNTEQTTSNVQE